MKKMAFQTLKLAIAAFSYEIINRLCYSLFDPFIKKITFEKIRSKIIKAQNCINKIIRVTIS